jgi:hypothetical protein
MCVFLQHKQPTGKSPSLPQLGENFSPQFSVKPGAEGPDDAQSILVGKTELGSGVETQ